MPGLHGVQIPVPTSIQLRSPIRIEEDKGNHSHKPLELTPFRKVKILKRKSEMQKETSPSSYGVSGTQIDLPLMTVDNNRKSQDSDSLSPDVNNRQTTASRSPLSFHGTTMVCHKSNENLTDESSMTAIREINS